MTTKKGTKVLTELLNIQGIKGEHNTCAMSTNTHKY
jgi:hypothetical protein